MKTFWNTLIWLDRTVNDKWLGGRVDPNHCQKAYFADRLHNPNLPD